MKKLLSGILSAVMLLTATSMAVSAQNDAELLLPGDFVSGTITNSDSSDLYYVDFSPMLEYDFDIAVNVDNAYDVFVELSDENGVLYTANNMNSEEIIELHAKNLEPGRYYVEVYGGVFDGSVLDYTLSCSCDAANPGVFSGTNLPFDSYQSTRNKDSYWKFTLDEASDVNFSFNAPTNKDFCAVIYNENGVYDYVDDFETSTITTHLNAGTYYIQFKVSFLGEDFAQIGITKA